MTKGDILPFVQDLSAGKAGGGTTTAESHAQSTAGATKQSVQVSAYIQWRFDVFNHVKNLGQRSCWTSPHQCSQELVRQWLPTLFNVWSMSSFPCRPSTQVFEWQYVSLVATSAIYIEGTVKPLLVRNCRNLSAEEELSEMLSRWKRSFQAVQCTYPGHQESSIWER